MNGATLEHRRLRVEEERILWQGLVELAKNPMVELAAGTMFLNWVTTPRTTDNFYQGILRGVETATLFPLMGSIILAQQLAPNVPYLSGKVSDLLALPPGGS